MRKAIGGENGRAVDAAIPDTIHSSATIMGLEKLQHTMKILHVVAVMPKSKINEAWKASVGEGKTLCRLCEWEEKP